VDVHRAGRPDRRELVSLLTGELRLGVVLFFVLSGFLLAGPWVASALDDRPAPRLGRFALKRAARVAPAYWVAMLGSFWLLSGTGHDYEVSASQLPFFAAFGRTTSARWPASSTRRCGRWWSK
jgi:peptidoglycan/LPS O-acetylase OafA/YrhL